MSAISEHKTSGIFSWLQSWFSTARPLTPSLMPADYQALTLELAAADDSALAAILHKCQQRLRYLLREHSLQLAVALPQADQAPALFCASGSATPGWNTALPSRLQEIQRRTLSAELMTQEILLADSAPVIAQPLLLKNQTNCGWLLICTRISDYDKESLHSLVRPLRQAFTEGLSIFQQRRDEVARSLRAERAAHAAELHDSLAQVLGYLRIRSARLQNLHSGVHSGVHSNKDCDGLLAEQLREISDDIADQTLLAYRQVRELISSSRLSQREESLEQLFRNAISDFEQHSAIVFQLDNRCPDLEITPQALTQLGYIVREALANIVRHSHASHARIRLTKRQQKIHLYIEDNGIGLQAGAGRSDSFGLTIMRERANSFGARLKIEERDARGTRVSISFRHPQHRPGHHSGGGNA